MRLSVPQQKAPVKFSLELELTSSQLVIDPTCLNLGRVNLGEWGTAPVTITSCSELEQYIAITGLPPWCHVSPNGGFGSLPPRSSVVREVHVRPELAGR